jgi:hypothetical protein
VGLMHVVHCTAVRHTTLTGLRRADVDV